MVPELSKNPCVGCQSVSRPYLPDHVVLLLHAGTFGNDQLVAALVDNTGAHCSRYTHTTHALTGFTRD